MSTDSYGRVLIIEDEIDVLELIKSTLVDAGYTTLEATRGEPGLSLIRTDRPDLLVLDIGLPDLDGISVCREARKTYEGPILMLSAKVQPMDKVIGLEVGADDYLSKPFEPRELVARIRALLRRTRSEERISVDQAHEKLLFGQLAIDLDSHTVSVGEETVHLTATEFSLLGALAKSPSKVFSREHLIETVWGHDFCGDSRTVDVHIRHLRQKLRTKDSRELIVAVRGVGYKFEAPRPIQH